MTRPLSVGLAGLLLGALAVAVLGRHTEAPLDRWLCGVGPPVSAACWYGLGLAGLATTTTAAGPVFWGRYADGIVTIPLLTVGLGLLAGADRAARLRAALVAAASMAATLAATLLEGVAALAATGLAVLLFLGLLGSVYGPLAPPPVASAAGVRRVRSVLVGLWLAYPVVWVLEPAGFALASDPALAWVAVALDLALKVGGGALLVTTAPVRTAAT